MFGGNHLAFFIGSSDQSATGEVVGWPGDEIADQLTFALRHEDLDLLILKRAFDAMSPTVLQELIAATPTGIPWTCLVSL